MKFLPATTISLVCIIIYSIAGYIDNRVMIRQGLLYYYHVVTGALTIYGEGNATDTSGVVHNCRADPVDKPILMQNGEGSRWESNFRLAPACCFLAPKEIYKLREG